jgi:hypothetical protein
MSVSPPDLVAVLCGLLVGVGLALGLPGRLCHPHTHTSKSTGTSRQLPRLQPSGASFVELSEPLPSLSCPSRSTLKNTHMHKNSLRSLTPRL